MIKELVEYMVKQLASKPDHVRIISIRKGDIHLLEIAVHQDDRGKVIGRNGQTIKAVRNLVNVVVPKGKKVTIDLTK